MSTWWDDAKPWLDMVALGLDATASAPGLPSFVAAGAKYLSLAIKAGERIASIGQDPAVAMERVASDDGVIDDAHAAWDAILDRRFGPAMSPAVTPAQEMAHQAVLTAARGLVANPDSATHMHMLVGAVIGPKPPAR
jgi:hypothetical protein